MGLIQKLKEFLNPNIRENTCNEEINIKDIRNNFLYTNDNRVMCYIKIQPLNLYLLSNKEQEQIIKQLSAGVRIDIWTHLMRGCIIELCTLH